MAHTLEATLDLRQLVADNDAEPTTPEAAPRRAGCAAAAGAAASDSGGSSAGTPRSGGDRCGRVSG